MTNYEKIQEKRKYEKLAIEILGENGYSCFKCPARDFCETSKTELCKETFVEWLESEAEEDG